MVIVENLLVAVLIDLDLVLAQQAHDDEIQVLAVLVGHLGIEQGRILALGQVKLTIDDLHPLQVGIVGLLHLIERLLPVTDSRCIALLFIPLAGIAARALGHLGVSAHGKRQEQQCDDQSKTFHFLIIDVEWFHC